MIKATSISGANEDEPSQGGGSEENLIDKPNDLNFSRHDGAVQNTQRATGATTAVTSCGVQLSGQQQTR